MFTTVGGMRSFVFHSNCTLYRLLLPNAKVQMTTIHGISTNLINSNFAIDGCIEFIIQLKLLPASILQPNRKHFGSHRTVYSNIQIEHDSFYFSVIYSEMKYLPWKIIKSSDIFVFLRHCSNCCQSTASRKMRVAQHKKK